MSYSTLCLEREGKVCVRETTNCLYLSPSTSLLTTIVFFFLYLLSINNVQDKSSSPSSTTTTLTSRACITNVRIGGIVLTCLLGPKEFLLRKLIAFCTKFFGCLAVLSCDFGYMHILKGKLGQIRFEQHCYN